MSVGRHLEAILGSEKAFRRRGRRAPDRPASPGRLSRAPFFASERGGAQVALGRGRGEGHAPLFVDWRAGQQSPLPKRPETESIFQTHSLTMEEVSPGQFSSLFSLNSVSNSRKRHCQRKTPLHQRSKFGTLSPSPLESAHSERVVPSTRGLSAFIGRR